jgi:hypothetical protein
MTIRKLERSDWGWYCIRALGLIAFQIVDADGVRQIVTLREPLMLRLARAFLG